MSGADDTREPVGLIAGQGMLPILVARGIRRAGHPVKCVGLVGQFERALIGECDEFRVVGLFQIGRWSRALRAMGVRRAVMVGSVDKARLMHDPLRLWRRRPDLRTLFVWFLRLRGDRRSGRILTILAEELARTGVELIDSTTHIQDHLAPTGLLTTRAPSDAERRAICFGWPIFREALRLHVGQSVAVRDGDVVAVEAVEGTDRMMARAGELCAARGWVLMKGAAPDHDRRADVPTVGEHTIRNLHEAGGRCLVLATGDVIIIERDRVVDLANQLGVTIVGVGPQGPEASLA